MRIWIGFMGMYDGLDGWVCMMDWIHGYVCWIGWLGVYDGLDSWVCMLDWMDG